jgi:hypothetical protein
MNKCTFPTNNALIFSYLTEPFFLPDARFKSNLLLSIAPTGPRFAGPGSLFYALYRK